MIDRLRFLLDRPLEPLAARAVVVFATAILIGLGTLFVLGASESSRSAAAGRQAVAVQSRPGHSFGAFQVEAPSPAVPRESQQRRQDPQDEKGSFAAGRVAKAMRSHRALQHVPYRRGHLSVRLVGARGGRAVLAVSAPTTSAARGGWRRFLQRYRDSGSSYVPVFQVAGGRDG